MYRFRVRAANEIGVSEPLDADRAIVAENPSSKSIYIYTKLLTHDIPPSGYYHKLSIIQRPRQS